MPDTLPQEPAAEIQPDSEGKDWALTRGAPAPKEAVELLQRA